MRNLHSRFVNYLVSHMLNCGVIRRRTNTSFCTSSNFEKPYFRSNLINPFQVSDWLTDPLLSPVYSPCIRICSTWPLTKIKNDLSFTEIEDIFNNLTPLLGKIMEIVPFQSAPPPHFHDYEDIFSVTPLITLNQGQFSNQRLLL